MNVMANYLAAYCRRCGAEAALDPHGMCDYCSIESSEPEHQANNTRLSRTQRDASNPPTRGA